MPSTYTLNNGIELIGTGEQSGTWGDTTNTNFELLDTALDGQVSVTLAATGSSGSPNTLPISDGASSNGRNRLVIFGDGGDLGGTAFVQLTPNDAEKIIYVRNNLSGSRSILLFQGTYNASNDYEVPAGTTAVVFFNGAGSGAVAANVFNNAFFDSLRLGSVSVDKILDEDNMASNDAAALATQQSIKAYVDAQVGTVDTLAEVLANGNTTGGTDLAVSTGDDITFADSSKAIFGAGPELQIYSDGTSGIIKDVGAGDIKILADDFYVQNAAGNSTLISVLDTGKVGLGFAGSEILATTSTGIDVTGDITLGDTNPTITFNDSSITNLSHAVRSASDNLQIAVDVNGVDAGSRVEIVDGATEVARFSAGAVDVTGTVTADGLTVDGDGTFSATNPTVDIKATNGNDASLILMETTGNDFGANGANGFRSRYDGGDNALYIQSGAETTIRNRIKVDRDTGDITFYDTDGTTASFVYDASAGTTFNEAGADRDFRVESDGNTHMLFVDASANAVGIGTNLPREMLHVSPAGNGEAIIALGDRDQVLGGPHGLRFYHQSGSAGDSSYFHYRTGDNTLNIEDTAEAQHIKFYTLTGGATFNETGRNDADFRVESTSNANMLYVDASANKVSVGSGAPQGAFNVIHDLNNSGDWWTNTKNAIYLQNSNSSGQTVVKFNNMTNTRGSIVFNTDGTSRFQLFDRTSTQERLGINSGELVINEDSGNDDFRVESDNNAHMLFVDAGADYINIGSSVRQDNALLQVTGAKSYSGSYVVRNQIIASDTTALSAGVTGGGIGFNGVYNAGGSTTQFGSVEGLKYNGNSGDYGGEVLIRSRRNGGNNEERASFSAAEAVFNEDSHNTDFRVESDGNTHAFFINAANNQIMFGDSSINATQAQVGISLTTAAAPHIVIGNTESSGNEYLTYYNRHNNDGGILQFRRGNATKGSVDVSTSGTTYNTTSDRRLKTDIQPIANGTEKLMAMNPVTHRWKADPDADAVHGFIAQEMQDVIPEAVSGDPDGEEMMSMDYGRITPVLVAALQDAHNKITALEKRLAELEAK